MNPRASMDLNEALDVAAHIDATTAGVPMRKPNLFVVYEDAESGAADILAAMIHHERRGDLRHFKGGPSEIDLDLFGPPTHPHGVVVLVRICHPRDIRDSTLQILVHRARHYNICTVLSVKKDILLPPVIRYNADVGLSVDDSPQNASAYKVRILEDADLRNEQKE